MHQLTDICEAASPAAGRLEQDDATHSHDTQRLRRRAARKSFSGFSSGFRHGVHELANVARRLSTKIGSKHHHSHGQHAQDCAAAASSDNNELRWAASAASSRKLKTSPSAPSLAVAASLEDLAAPFVGFVGSSASTTQPTPSQAVIHREANMRHIDGLPATAIMHNDDAYVGSTTEAQPTLALSRVQLSRLAAPVTPLTASTSASERSHGSRLGKDAWAQDCESAIDVSSDAERAGDASDELMSGWTSRSRSRTDEVVRRDFVTHLPVEVSVHVFSFLDAESLKNAELVSRAWYAQASSRHVWRDVFRRHHDYHAQMQKRLARRSTLSQTTALGLGCTRYNQDWKKMYAVRSALDARWREGKAAAIYLHGHTDSVYCVQFDENKIITGSRDRTIRVWNARYPWNCLKIIGSPDALQTNATLTAGQQHNGNAHLNAAANHNQNGGNNNNQTAANDNNTTNAINPATIPPPTTVVVNPSTAPGGKTPFMSLSPPSMHVDSNADLAVPSRPGDFFHNASILCLQYDDEIMVSGSSDATCIVWDMKDNYRPIRRLHGHSAGVLDVCFDDRYIISCSKDTMICVWDRRTGALIKKLMGHHGPVNAVQLRGDCVVSASGDGVAKLWNISSGTCIKEFTSRNRGLACVEFSENARYILAGGNDQVIYEFDANSGELLREMHGHTTLVRSLHLDSVNRRIVSGSYDMSVKVFDAETGELRTNLPNWTTSWILSAKSDYRRIVATSQDARAVIMDFGYQATAPVRPGQDNPGPTRPWADQYPPLNLSELAVHHKKVSDVQRWLSDAFQGRHQQKVLVLRGPAGSGKTMTVTLLAKLMGFELVEWRQPAVSEGSSASSLSLSAQFDEFLNRGEQFGALTLAEGSQSPDGGDVDAHVEAAKHDRRALLIEEFPALLGPASIGLQSFRAAVQKYLAAATTPSSPPVIMVVSEAMLNSAGGPHGSFSAFRLLGPEICSHPGLAFIDFNPVAPTFLSKAFTLVLKKHAQRTRRRCDLRPAAIKHFTGTGDIRSAISAVEFYCLQGEHASRPTGSAAPPRSRARSARPTTTHEPLQVVTQREASLGLFHATSKVVHNKRDAPADAADPMLVLPAPPPHLSQHARPLVSQVETESLMNDTGTDASTFLASLHENFPLSCSGAAFCAHFDDCMEYLSQADLLASDSYSSLRGSRAGTGSARSSVLQGYSGEGSDLLRQDEISFHVGVRGLLFALPCPVKRTQGGAGSSRAGCGFAADAHKMYYPTSAQLWRRTEEMEGLLDHWVAKLARHQAAEIASAKSARPWQSQRPATAISAPPNPTTAPPRCLQTRDDVLLERLPYLRRITRDEGERRSLDRVTQYRGIGSRWSQLPDVPEAGPDERGMRSGYTQPAADGSVAHAPPSEAMEQLILSDDDIEDDDDD
ncbi:Cell cycle checkpoint protein rad17 [Ascosphaera acerosa]|nr:Cell cycle checkpoint protein rad17 [Ascosphaera acerosa]